MVGQLQWLVTLGRFDLHAHVATMSRFRAAPRQGHMVRLTRIYAHAIRTKDYAVRFRTDQPDYSFLPEQDFDWSYSVYGDVHEILPDDMPEPLGEAVVTTTTMDANLNHHNNKRHSPISLEVVWATKYWPNHVFSFLLGVTEVNVNLATTYFCGQNQKGQIEFQKLLAKTLIFNT